MAREIKVPPLPESVSDATVLKWHKKPGDTVNRDENLVDLETDKVVLEVPSPISGVIKNLVVPEGTIVKSEELLALIEEGVVAEVKPKATEAAAPAKPETKEDISLSPAVRRLVSEHDIKPNDIKGTGKEGRIVKEDVVAHLQKGQGSSQVMLSSGDRIEKRVPMSRLRTKIAERLVQAQNTAAMLTTFNEVNMQAIMDLRKQFKDAFEKKHGVKLGLLSFFVKAICEALKAFPSVNASIEGNDILYHGYYDIGIAVSTERGLVVPVLRDADKLNMADIERAIVDFATRARDNKLSLEEMQGGTFTLTNGGIFGSLLSTPIINPPQTGILGLHNIQERPIAENNQVVIRPMMYTALSYDHRLIDGKESVQFLVLVKQLLENPIKMLLEIA